MDFNPPKLLRNSHLQSILPELLVIGKKSTLHTSIHEAEQGKPFVLAERTIQTENDSPVFVLIPGIEGSHDSPVIRLLLASKHFAECPMFVISHRGITLKGDQITPYHAGLTNDLSYVAKLLRLRYPNRPIHAAGFSMGANILLQYASKNSHPLNYVTAISTPFDLRACTDRIPMFYQRIILRRMRQRSEHSNAIYNTLNWKAIKRIRDIDENLVAPHFGYRSAVHYYEENSSKDHLHNITCPTTLVNAYDDLFISPSSWPNKRTLPKNIRMITPKHGGHMGFRDGNRWLETLLFDFSSS